MLEAEQYDQQRETLDPKKLLAEAQAVGGLADFGDNYFIAPMGRLMDRAAREVDFTSKGIGDFKADVIRYLVNRLRTQEDIKRHPEILQEDVSDPIIIIGLPHSGTTKMQRMLAAAPQVQKLLMWRMMNPAPFPDAIPGQPDPRIEADGLQHLVEKDKDPYAAMSPVAHAVDMNLVDEEFVLTEFSLDESIAGFHTALPLFNYQDWAPGRDRESDRSAYRYLRTQLQYLQWQDGGKRKRPWIMKAIFHIAHMDVLLECFPKATLLHAHRDPRNAIPGIAKGMWAGWSTKTKVPVDKKFVGQEFLKWGAAAMNRYLEARKRLQLDGRILDVKYDNIRSNIMPDLREAYRRAGWTMSAAAEQAMLQWEITNEHGKHGKNVYSLEEFGLSDALIDQAFAEYIRRFIAR